jgi:hypothetical protein
MSEDKILEELKKILAQRVKTSSIPPKLSLNIGEEAIVRVVDVIENPWRPDRRIYIVYSLIDSQEYRLPSHASIERVLMSEQVKVGDYLLLRLDRVRNSGERKFYAWSVGVLKAEEAMKILEETKSSAQIPEKSTSTETKTESKKEDEAKKQTEIKENTQSLEELKKYVEAMTELFGSITLADLDHYVNKIKKLNLKIDQEFVKSLGFSVEGDKIVKRA